MKYSTETAIQPQHRVMGVQSWQPAWKIVALVVGVLFLTVSSYIAVPMRPVPITMQTFAVTLIGALYGFRLGGLTIVAWLIVAVLGLPVLAGGARGFWGPTAGYLFAFPISGMVMGWFAARGWNGHHVFRAFIAMLLGNALCLVLGAAWLATSIGCQSAFVVGVLPFVLGGCAKALLGALTLKLLVKVGFS